jgi:hypothetical protein
MREDALLPLASALTVARHKVAAQDAIVLLQRGQTGLGEALTATGSYGRLDVLLAAHEQSLVPTDDVLDALVEHWVGSDPDDTDRRYLELWRQAWERNDRQPVTDGQPLPEGHVLTVYRGQDRQAPLGIAWSLHGGVAQRFAMGAGTGQRDRQGRIHVARVRREDVLAYLTRRDEAEVICDPDRLTS